MNTTEENKQAKYLVIIEIEDPVCLADDEKVKEILSQVSLRGKLFSNICFAQSDDSSLGMVKKFALEYEEDFTPFAEALIEIPGVKNIKKGDGPWKRTWKEHRQIKKENQRIRDEKIKMAEEFQKKRKKDSEVFLALVEERRNIYKEKYGLNDEKLCTLMSWKRFYQLTESMKSCTGEFFVTFSDILMGGPFKFAHETIENVSVEEAVIFLLKCINDNLVSFVSPLESLESLPFSWDVKEKNGKKLALLDIGCGKPTFIMAQYGFYIAEI